MDAVGSGDSKETKGRSWKEIAKGYKLLIHNFRNVGGGDYYKNVQLAQIDNLNSEVEKKLKGKSDG